MTSADFCPIAPAIADMRAARVALGFGGNLIRFPMNLSPTPLATNETLGFSGELIRFQIDLSLTPIASRLHLGQISPDKNANCHCTTASFTVSPEPEGFVMLC